MQTSKLKSDLQFIGNCLDFCKKREWRMVVYGGYGLDGYFKKISRKHGDIDLVIYGADSHNNASKSISQFLKSLYPNSTIDQTENPYQLEINSHDKGFHLNLYYVQTKSNPFQNIHTVIKTNGESTTNDPSIFPLPQKGNLEGLDVEVQEQKAHLKDILAKGGANETKYKNDLTLLSSLSSPI